ncbi:MAG: hypothetical protein ABIH23_05950 [bacterium]
MSFENMLVHSGDIFRPSLTADGEGGQSVSLLPQVEDIEAYVRPLRSDEIVYDDQQRPIYTDDIFVEADTDIGEGDVFYQYDPESAVEVTGTTDAGSSVSQIIDDALTQADDYWNGSVIKCTTGSNSEKRVVEDFDAATDKVTPETNFTITITPSTTVYDMITAIRYKIMSIERNYNNRHRIMKLSALKIGGLS